ncbi:hypothetical protein AX17_001149 [Amanita inopinata Kibby_2008]|nr:hypothetical protein AX17_001149 [Amanita inopinata Kibby_2008]
MAAVLLPATTPTDYFNIISPALAIPSDPQVPVPVGLLACQRDPFLKELETVIIQCTISHPRPPNVVGTKNAKKSVISPPLPSDPLLEVVLHDTVIFPEGGGQPTDIGIVKIISSGVEWEVIQAKRHGGYAVHYVRVPDGDVNAAMLAFSPRTKVIVSLGQQGFIRRYDHMSMHTSQHLLSAILEMRLGLPTLSWSLTNYPNPCYVEVPRGMTHDEIISIQNEANDLVFEGRRVRIEVQELDKEQEKSDQPLTLKSGRTVGKGLPDDYTGGVKRVVVIDGIDRNPCCGTHLPSIHNLQLFLLPHTEALSRSSTTSARLYFLSGSRLIVHLTSTHGLLTHAASILSCGAPLVPERVEQVVEERKRAVKRVADLELELARRVANKLILDMNSIPNQLLYKKHIHRTDDTENPLGFLTAISFAVSEAMSSAASSYLLILTSSSTSQSSTSTNVVLVFGSDEWKVKDVGEHLKSMLDVKGGGKGPKWSGKFTGIWKEGRQGLLIGNILKDI